MHVLVIRPSSGRPDLSLMNCQCILTHTVRQTEIPALLGSWVTNTPIHMLCPQNQIGLSLYFRKYLAHLSVNLLTNFMFCWPCVSMYAVEEKPTRCTIYLQYISPIGFGGLEVACWPLVPKFAGSNPVRFLGRKNPQHDFLRRGSKAVGPVS